MRVLVTGGAGFLGSHLAERLLEHGHEVLILDDFSTGRDENVPSDAQCIDGTITDPRILAKSLGWHPETVAHAAASYADPDNWDRDALVNALGTARLMHWSRLSGVQRIVYFQTALCYGTKPQQSPITLQHPINPDSSYAISKTAGERYIELSGLDYVSMRLANAYGPRNLTGPVPAFYKRLADGQQPWVADSRRDFVFVDDIIDAVTMAVEGTGHGHYHLSSGKDVAIKDVLYHVADAMGMTGDAEVRPRSEDDAGSILLDPSRTIADFGWQPTTPLAEGVARAVEWYEEHGVEQTYTHLKVPT